jgi:hypothetical protein
MFYTSKTKKQNKKSLIYTRNNISSENNYNKISSIKDYGEINEVNRIVMPETKHSAPHSDL